MQTDNAELVRRLEQEEGSEESASDAEVEAAKYLVFRVGESRYALAPGFVLEIMIDVPRYFVPFAPAYVRGLINRHGEPYAVLDLAAFLGHEPLEASTYLVLNVDADQVALSVSDVVEILPVAVSDISEVASAGESEDSISGSFELGGTRVLILDVMRILSRLKSDAGRE